MAEIKFGWHKDKYDRRDYLHKPRLVRLPDKVDLSALRPSVRDQGYVSSCVGFGIGGAVGAMAKSVNVFTEWFSPTWFYNGARFIEGTLSYDEGCYPKDALDWLVDKGRLLERFWPYDLNKLDQSAPSSERQSQAIKYPDLAYFRCVDGAEGICSALADSQASFASGGIAWLVAIGTPWFALWMKPGSDGVLSEATTADNIVGGHATFLFGYDLTERVFYGQNSWSSDWGNNGCFTMPMSAFNVFKQLGGYDAHYIKFTLEAPTPEPTPAPKPCCKKITDKLTKMLRR